MGAGFSAPAGLPTWKALLARLAHAPELDPLVRTHVSSVAGQPHPSAHALDQAAQLLEDSLGRARFIDHLRREMVADAERPAMRERLRWLREIPFRAIVTTNFDSVIEGLVPGPDAYHDVLRPRDFRWWDRTFWGEASGGPAVLKLHGDLEREDATEHVVLTRRDYRRRLYGDPGYMTFLRGLLSSNTVLFMGFSFEDAYLNELRSQVLALFDYRKSRAERPLAYAILHDVPDLVRLHYDRHEGIAVMPFDSGDPPDFGGFDGLLEAIWSRTALLPRFGRLLAGRRLLWLDPHPHNNEAGYRFLERSAAAHGGGEGPIIRQAATVDEALDALRGDAAGRPFELVITHWGQGDARDDAGRSAPNGTRLLECMRRQDLRCPVIIFSGARDIQQRTRRALSLGALDYCHRWEVLFQHLDRLFGSPTEPASAPLAGEHSTAAISND